MNEQDKQLLLKDLCARLPYGVKVRINHHHAEIIYNISSSYINDCPVHLIEPYLRPMSSMTLEEGKIYDNKIYAGLYSSAIDYLNSIHIDYRGLIPMNLALEAPEGMYN